MKGAANIDSANPDDAQSELERREIMSDRSIFRRDFIQHVAVVSARGRDWPRRSWIND